MHKANMNIFFLDHFSLHINCGGKEVLHNGTTYEADDRNAAPSIFFTSRNNNWAISNTGNFMDDAVDVDNYIISNTSELPINDSQIYRTARLSPLSLTYYGLCLLNGNYTVNLHFAEIVFRNDSTYFSFGRRIFDVYIQVSSLKQCSLTSSVLQKIQLARNSW